MDAVTREKSYAVFASLLEQNNKIPANVANDLGLSSTVFSDWKSNKSAPNVEKLILIANYFNVPITVFFES